MRRGRYGAVSRSNPEAAGVCDRGGEVRKLSALRREMIYAGNRLVWNGMLCCERHIDPPHPQDRLLVLKPDPVPVKNPRPLRRMLPKGGFITDGIATAEQTESYVTDDVGAPLSDDTADTVLIDDEVGEQVTDDNDGTLVTDDTNGAPITGDRFPE
jgi:hypothetical protein